MNDMNQKPQQSSMIPGISIIGCFMVGIAGLIGAMAAMFDLNDFVGGGACLVASAVAFGLAANAVFRK
ncbi:MAG: hypothetical protein H8E53_01820 [Planctomycetes bacterium]|nr:hypothetical protein [Planctomycetota bacterium]